MLRFVKILAFLALFETVFSDDAVIELPLGKIRGYVRHTYDGRQFFAFEGVPYAKPPINELRFEPPEEVEGWTGVLETKTLHKCLQYFHNFTETDELVIGDEDCLYMNIYTPTLDKTAKLDVIFYIHGGAFMFNYGGSIQPDILLNRDLILITINYRLGPLGFLSTEDNVVPGNMGLKDQIQALKFTRQFIKHFGGNSDSITIGGNSAGGASVHLHSLIPESKGLYHRAISQSGCALNPWVLMEAPLEYTKKIASLLNCDTEKSTKSIVKCLKKKSGDDLVAKVKNFQPWLYNPFSPWGVVVDSWAKRPLLPKHPYILLKNHEIVNNVPWMISFTGSEGIYPVGDFYQANHLDYLDEHWNAILPHVLHYNYTVKPKDRDAVSQKIREFYFQDKKLSKETYMNLVAAASDRLFRADIQKAVHLYSKKDKVFVYGFVYRGQHSYSEIRTRVADDFGASHVDDLLYILDMGIDTQSDPADRKVSQLLVNIWASFAKRGIPDYRSFLAEPSTEYYFKIAGPSDVAPQYGDFGQQEFWDSLPMKENEKLFDDRVRDEF